MGFLNEMTGLGGMNGLIGGGGLGIPTYPSQIAAIQLATMQQQQAVFDPFGFQRQQSLLGQMMMPYQPPRCVKHVESREVTLMEDARKLINGAVQEVKQAQKEV